MSIRSVTTEQPEKLPPPSPTSVHARPSLSVGGRIKHFRSKVTTRHGWFGDYDYAWLCMPTVPWRRKGKQSKIAPPFYALDSDLPLILAAASGLQHALAMLAGLITPPIIFASALSLDSATSAYMISASLIGCGKFISKLSMSCIHQALYPRYPQSCADVPHASLPKLLPGHWFDIRCRHEFRYAQHCERG